MELKVTDEQLQQLVSVALLNTLTPEIRDGYIRDAIRQLLAPKHGQSDLRNAFELAVRNIAEKMVMEKLQADPETMAGLKQLIDEGWAKATGADNAENHHKLVDRVARTLSETLFGRNY